jgi:hypothetical protein
MAIELAVSCKKIAVSSIGCFVSNSVLNKPDIYQAKQIDCLADEPSRQMERARFEIVA